MGRRKIHLIAPAGSCRPFLAALELSSAADLLALVQEYTGADYLVVGDEFLIAAEEDEDRGGRDDDRRRAEDIEQALGDPEVVAIVTIRGGAWFTRILPFIDFTILDRRPEPVTVFGFSELTTLVNIVGAHRNGRGIYDMGPAFLMYGLKRHAVTQLGLTTSDDSSAAVWMGPRLRPELRAFFRDVVSIIEGRGTDRAITAELISGELPDSSAVTFVGGNLTVLIALVGTPYQRFIEPTGRWLVIEDLNEKPERLDRFLAQLTLAGFWNECAGLLLGDFHKGDRTLTEAVAALLAYHLPSTRTIPVLTSEQVGHIWPMSPLPLHTPMRVERIAPRQFSILGFI